VPLKRRKNSRSCIGCKNLVSLHSTYAFRIYITNIKAKATMNPASGLDKKLSFALHHFLSSSSNLSFLHKSTPHSPAAGTSL
jgi:hypothetical protein